MKSVYCFLVLLFIVNSVLPQSWSDPINISGIGPNDNPDFTIDKNGVIHCVWSQAFDHYFTKIYYAKSVNNGKTWSTPVPITTNTNLWLDDPHIVADTLGNLYVSYDYNVGGWTKICFVKFNVSDSGWSQQTEIATGVSNKLIIDHNNRLYFFWFAGTEYYRYLDNNVLSDTLSPNSGVTEHYYFDNLTVDINNNIHCVGNRTAGNHSHGAYFKCIYGNWSQYLDLSNHSFFESGVSLNSIGNPSFVWRQIMPDSLPDVRGSYYAELDGDSVQPPVFLAMRTSYPTIAIDNNDQPHIVESQAVDSGYQLFHRYVSGNVWQNEVLEQNKNWYGKNILISKNSFIYLVYNKVDTTFFSTTGSHNAMIVFRKIEIVPGMIEENQKPELVLYPNPFSEKITLKLLYQNSNPIHLKIFDIYGRTVYEERYEEISPYLNSLVWNGNNNLGAQVKDGCYILQISQGSRINFRTVIRMNR